MSAITNFFGALINAITAFFGGIFGIFNKKKNGEFFLEIDPSKESASAPAVVTPVKAAAPAKKEPKKEPKKAKAPVAQAAPQAAASVASVNQALNMPKPKVATIEPLDIPKFGPARRPGANMKSFLDMAKTVKS